MVSSCIEKMQGEEEKMQSLRTGVQVEQVAEVEGEDHVSQKGTNSMG